MIHLNVEEDVVVGIDSGEILKEIQSARQDWLLVGNVKKWGTKDDDFVFTLKSSGRDIPTVDIEVGGVLLEGVLVDSGSTCNVIDRATWEELKEKKVKCV